MTAYRFGMAFFLLAALLLASTQAWAARFFRYTDETGRLVISHTIPNDRVKFGYEIVDENARLIQTIEPQLSEEEYQAKLAREAARKECEEAVNRVQTLYRSVPDIDYAEAQALDWRALGLSTPLRLRIALHAGPVYEVLNPIINRKAYMGAHVSQAARIEPITPPGQVYASQAFAAVAAATGVEELAFEYVGRTALAKEYGSLPLYYVRRR